MSSPINHHPDSATLVSFAAGTLAEPLAAVVASHVSMCPECRRGVRELEALGGVLLMSGPSMPGPIQVAPFPKETRPKSAPPASGEVGILPRPIATSYGLSFESIPWRWLGPGVWHCRLPLSMGVEGDLRLLKISPGRAMPDHGHGGGELTLVLEGAYADTTGKYCAGDVQDVDEEIDHSPVADPVTGCICLIASEKPAHFRSWIGKIFQPFTGM